MQTPETMIMAGTAIKIIIDMLPAPSEYKRPLAIVFGLMRAFAFIQGPIDTTIFFGITTGASAIGVHEITKGNSKPNTDTEIDFLSGKFNADDTTQ